MEAISFGLGAAMTMAGEHCGVKVSVLVMTYNHARFIEQALQSVLAQRTDFDFEILISEDCSTDGTRETVTGYQRAYPQKIRLLLSDRNLHSNAVVDRGIRAARGQYIALLDGDDYWIDPDKLQKQVAFLDRHTDCAICFHNAKVLDENNHQESRSWTPANQKAFSQIEDLWMGNFIPTCSTMYRNLLSNRLPEWYRSHFVSESLFITDWPLHLLHAEHGRIGYINEVMGVYRLHSGGLYSPQSEMQKLDNTFRFYRSINASFDYKYDSIIKVAITKYFFEWAQEYMLRGDLKNARRCFEMCLHGALVNRYISPSQLLRMGARLYVPLLKRIKTQESSAKSRSL